MRIHIRSAGLDDQELVRSVLERSYPAGLADHYEPALLTRALPVLCAPSAELLNSTRYHLVLREAEAVACGGWSVDPPPQAQAAGKIAVIRRFAVVPELAGQGIGRSLFEHCLGEARAYGAERLLVRASLNAEPFYARLGFERLYPIDKPLAGGSALPCVLMERELA
jgi:N-acetylglutamate synthase-like GNAT family acetyltransferase